MLTRKDIFNEAVLNCYRELFKRAQPSVNYDELLKNYQEGKITETRENPIYNRYYLSHDEYKYVLNKYIDAYKLKAVWGEYIDILIEYLEKGGSKDKYIDEHTDEHGNYHPGYRGYEKVNPLKQQIGDIIHNEYDGNGEIADKVTNKITEKVFELINNCKDFYRFDHDESDFHQVVGFGCSPTSNKQTVIDYWRKQGVDLEIEERNPLLFWEQDYYEEDFETIMQEDFGDNWKEIWDKKWQEEKDKEEKRKTEFLELLKKQQENE